MVTKTKARTTVRKSTTGYRVKISTTTISQSFDRAAATKVAKAAKAEIAQRGVRGAKVAIIRG